MIRYAVSERGVNMHISWCRDQDYTRQYPSFYSLAMAISSLLQPGNDQILPPHSLAMAISSLHTAWQWPYPPLHTAWQWPYPSSTQPGYGHIFPPHILAMAISSLHTAWQCSVQATYTYIQHRSENRVNYGIPDACLASRFSRLPFRISVGNKFFSISVIRCFVLSS